MLDLVKVQSTPGTGERTPRPLLVRKQSSGGILAQLHAARLHVGVGKGKPAEVARGAGTANPCWIQAMEVADGDTRGGNEQQLDAAADEAKQGSSG